MPTRPPRLRRALALPLAGLLLAPLAWTAATAAPGDTRAEPVPFAEEGAAGPWRLTILEVVTGADATTRVTDASPFNEPPRDGFTYVLVRLRAQNAGDRAQPLSGDDFALTGASGTVRRFVGAVSPEPTLDAVVPAGETRDGWLVLGAPADETNLLLLFDSVALSGRWADRVFALQPGATIPDGAAAAQPDQAGTDSAAAVGLNEPFATAEWQVEVLEVVQGAAVYDLMDFRTQALGIDQAVNEDPWLALRLRVTDVRAGGAPAFLPTTAFMLVNADGVAEPDALYLTPPVPDLSAAFYPGASREGWIAFEVPAPYVESGATLIRFLPFREDDDPRYLTYGGDDKPSPRRKPSPRPKGHRHHRPEDTRVPGS